MGSVPREIRDMDAMPGKESRGRERAEDRLQGIKNSDKKGGGIILERNRGEGIPGATCLSRRHLQALGLGTYPQNSLLRG